MKTEEWKNMEEGLKEGGQRLEKVGTGLKWKGKNIESGFGTLDADDDDYWRIC